MRRLLLLLAFLPGLAFATSIGICVPSAVSSSVGNPCRPGDSMFTNFSDSDNMAATNVSVHFQMANSGIRGWGSFANPAFSDPESAASDMAPVAGLKDQPDFSHAPGSAGLILAANAAGRALDLLPGSEAGGPAEIAATPVTATLTGDGRADGAAPGLSRFEPGDLQGAPAIQAVAAVPEPGSFGLLCVGLAGLNLLRKRAV